VDRGKKQAEAQAGINLIGRGKSQACGRRSKEKKKKGVRGKGGERLIFGSGNKISRGLKGNQNKDYSGGRVGIWN